LPQRIEVRETHSKTVLHRLEFGRGQVEYTANLYKGCTHGCVYCYAPSLVHDERSWGSFVDAKVNAPARIRRELKVIRKAPVFLSSASDPYQPLEARYRITRRCLEELHASGFPVVILTRSPLVLRDLQLLRKMKWVRAGCSISTASNRFYEPGVPPLERRLQTLRALKRAGIMTWVSLAPILPGISTVEIKKLVSMLKEIGVDTVTPGLLRFQGYRASKEMFETSTGLLAENVMLNAEEAISEAREAIATEGFMEPEKFFQWDEAPERPPGLDDFFAQQA
jgi:DNA repair photolyase